jgi:hypothetical protein
MDFAAASGTSVALLSLGKIVGIFLGVFIVFVLSLIVYIDIWLKFHTRGKVTALFIDNKSIFGALLTIEDSNKVYYGKGDKREMYVLDDKKQYLSLYPAGLPRFLQIVVRTYWYIRNNPTPVDVTGRVTPLTSRMLRQISDEAMVKQTWKDVRESAGVGAQKKASNLALYLVFASLALIAFNLYLTMQYGGAIKIMKTLLEKVYGVAP